MSTRRTNAPAVLFLWNWERKLSVAADCYSGIVYYYKQYDVAAWCREFTARVNNCSTKFKLERLTSAVEVYGKCNQNSKQNCLNKSIGVLIVFGCALWSILFWYIYFQLSIELMKFWKTCFQTWIIGFV